MKTCKLGILIWFVPFFLMHGQTDSSFNSLCLNQIQIIGSHNSYKEAIDIQLWKFIELLEPRLAHSLQYEHIPLDEQLNLGLRNLELDVLYDPDGGRFRHPLGIKIMNVFSAKPTEYDSANNLLKPGLKTFHIPDFDFRSHNLLFKDCLRVIKKWSDKNKNHIPIFVTMNAKDDPLPLPGAVDPLPFTKSALHSIDEEIRSVFNEDELIIPDLIKSNYSTLEEAILKKGWPRIEEVKGRVLFILDETGKKLENYLGPEKSLSGKVLFVNAEEGNSCAAIRIVNDPIRDKANIKRLVQKGYIVRTRADSDTKEARENNYQGFNNAVESGAQIITTDYYLPSKLFHSDYCVMFTDHTYIKKNDFVINHGK
jgi:hypothetical protein